MMMMMMIKKRALINNMKPNIENNVQSPQKKNKIIQKRYSGGIK